MKPQHFLKECNYMSIKIPIHSRCQVDKGRDLPFAVPCFVIKKILIFDEPTSGLDGRNMLLIAKELKNAANKGKTVLVITHDEELIAECCDYRLNLNEL